MKFPRTPIQDVTQFTTSKNHFPQPILKFLWWFAPQLHQKFRILHLTEDAQRQNSELSFFALQIFFSLKNGFSAYKKDVTSKTLLDILKRKSKLRKRIQVKLDPHKSCLDQIQWFQGERNQPTQTQRCHRIFTTGLNLHPQPFKTLEPTSFF